MAEYSRPWQGITIGDHGVYSASQWAEAWARAAGFAGQRANAGLLYGTGDTALFGLRVLETAGGATAAVRVTPGSALVQGIFYRNTSALNLSIAANSSGNPRIDMIVLRVDYAAQTVRLAVKQGTPAGSPVRPSLTQIAGVTWEVPLGLVAVANGFVTIVTADCTPIFEPANAPNTLVHYDILNNSGIELKTGDVVIWDKGTNLAVTVSTDIYKASGRVAGIWQGLTPAGGWGRVLARGITFVRVNGAVAIANPISAHSVATEGVVGAYGTFARALQSQSATGYIQCLVDTGVEFIAPRLMAECIINPAQSIPNGGAITQVTNWVDGVFKTVAGMHFNGSNPARLYMPRLGMWQLTANLDLSGVDGTYRGAYLVDSAGGTILEFHRPNAAVQSAIPITAPVYILNNNDYVTISVRHDGTAARNLGVASWVRWYFVGDGLP